MRKFILAFAVALVLFVACKKEEAGVATDVTTTASGNGIAFRSEAGKAAAASNSATTALTVAAAPPSPKPAPSPRMIVRTATLSLIVSDAVEAMQAITRQAAQAGGYVTDSKQWRENNQLRGSVTVRVPSNRFEELTGLAKKSAVRVQSESVTGEDVTQEFSDLGARLRNSEAAEVELRELLTSVRQKTQKAADVLEVYEKLNEVRGEIEQTKGRMQYLGQVTAMSTITVELIPDVLAQPVVEPGWRPSAIAPRAVHALVESLKWLADTAIWLGIYVLPMLLLLGLALVAIRWLAQRFIRIVSKPPTLT